MRILFLFLVLAGTFCGVSKLLEAGPSSGNVVAYECEGATCSQAIKEFVETGSKDLIIKLQKNNLMPTDTVFLKTRTPIAYLSGNEYENEMLTDDLKVVRADSGYFYDVPQVQILINHFDGQKLDFVKTFLEKFKFFQISEILIKREDFFEAEVIYERNHKVGRYRLFVPVAFVYDDQVSSNLEVLADYLVEHDVLRKTILVSPKGKLIISRADINLVAKN